MSIRVVVEEKDTDVYYSCADGWWMMSFVEKEPSANVQVADSSISANQYLSFALCTGHLSLQSRFRSNSHLEVPCLPMLVFFLRYLTG